MKKVLIITPITSICLIIIVVLFSILFGQRGYATPREAFEQVAKSGTIDFSQSPHKKITFKPLEEIVVLPMGDYMVRYMGYVQNTEDENDIRVLSIYMKVENGHYKPQASGFFSTYEFESKKTDKDNSVSYCSVEYTIVPKNSSEIENFDPETYSFVHTQYTDTKGKKQNVVFCYTYEVYWKPGDGSMMDKF